MIKTYIHLFETESDFEEEYGSPYTTALTSSVSTEDGTFYYGGYDNFETLPGVIEKVHIWKNDNIQYWRFTDGNERNPSVGDELFTSWSDYKEITATTVESVSYGYLEPWVSYTEETDKVNFNKKYDFVIYLNAESGESVTSVFQKINITPEEFCQEDRMVTVKVIDPWFVNEYGYGSVETEGEFPVSCIEIDEESFYFMHFDVNMSAEYYWRTVSIECLNGQFRCSYGIGHEK